MKHVKERSRKKWTTVASAFALVIGSLLLVSSPANAVAKAFPGAEGYGSNSVGGRGGTVCKVTNLNDSGAGSLRACVTASGPRYVVFTTGGTIELQSRIDISNPFITIAGQTAPGDGITLKMASNPGYDKGTMNIYTHDVVIRFIRFRPGNPGAADDSHDALAAYEQGGDVYNIVLDHNSFSWAVDENVNFYYDARDITFSNNIVSEALSNAGHPDGEHSKGMLIGGGTVGRQSLFRNLFVSNVDRNPQVSGVPNTDLRNNVVYNYGDGSGDGVTLISSSKGIATVNWINNYYKPGPDSDPTRAEFATYEGDTGQSQTWYGSGNKRWTASGDLDARVASGSWGSVGSAFSTSPVTTVSASQAKTEVLAEAGASKVRDAVDTRLVNQFNNSTGSLVDSVSQAGGWPTLNTGTPWADSDNDGMSNAAETAYGGSPNGDTDGDGYENIEEWFAELAGDQGGTTPPPTNDPPTANAGSDFSVDEDIAVALQGSGTDPENDPLTYSWSVSSGTAANVSFVDSTSPTTNVTFSEPGSYGLTLTANDGNSTDTDTVGVTVNTVGGGTTNTAPVVDVGPDKTGTIPDGSTDGTVAVSASVTDPDIPPEWQDNPAGYYCSGCHYWQVVSYPAGTNTAVNWFTDSDDFQTSFRPNAGGTWVLRFTVIDGEHTVSDELTVEVTDENVTNPPPPEPATNLNCPVVADPQVGATVVCTFE